MIAHVSPAVAPTGMVALVFTNVQGSTRLWERCGEGMRQALEVHDRVLRALLATSSGYEVKTQGDSFMIAFPTVEGAVRWCLDAQEALVRAPWPEAVLAEPEAAEEHGPRGLLHRGPRVRMGVHLGEPERRVDASSGRVDYFGRMVNETARVASAGHGGQVLLSGPAWARAQEALGALGRPTVRMLGEFRLKGIEEPVALVEMLPASLADRRFSGLRVPEERRGNVPEVVGDTVGRERELARLRDWLAEGAQLITILGPGGMGKTRLALRFGGLQLAARAWEGGVWVCELTEAATVDDICHAVGQALGVALSHGCQEGASAERLGRALAGGGATLVILDNVEQVVHHIPATLGRWLALAPQARFVVTSREALRLPGERVLDLAPLSLPPEGETRREQIARSDAVRLFVQRARAERGDFELTDEEAPRVAQLVRELEGIALAIELAAARTRLLGLAQLQTRLARRFEVLRGGSRATSARHDTLWGAIDWSWNLLEPAERAALAQCSVFRGGFTLEAAEAVLLLPPGAPTVPEVLESLRTKSLLRMHAPDGQAGEPRLGLYESIRQYASARLVEREQGPAVMARHADCYLALACELRERVQGGGGVEALRQLAQERENLLAACDNALTQAPATPQSLARAVGALVALEPDVTARGPLGIVLTRLDRALELLAATLPGEPLLRAEALAVRGRAHLGAGQLVAAQRDLQQAQAAFAALGAVTREKRVLVDLSIVSRHAGDTERAWSLVRQAQTLPAEGDRWLEAYTVGNLGLIELARHGAEAAVPSMRAALELFRGVGDATFEVGFLINCALAIGEAGGTGEAVALLGEALHKATLAGDRAGQALAQLNLGCFLLEEDRGAEACEHLEMAVHAGRQLGMRILEGTALGELGRASLTVGMVSGARTYLEEAISILAQMSRSSVLRFSAHLATVDAVLGDLPSARRGFDALEASPELRGDPVLGELASLLRALVELAEAQAAPPDSRERQQALEQARRRLERGRNAPPQAASSDLRGALRFVERCWEVI